MPARLALAVSAIAALMLALSGPGTRLGLWEWRMGLDLLRWALFAGLAGAALSILLLVIPRTRAGNVRGLVAALVLGIVASLPVLGLFSQAKRLPYIHDITTDTANPPGFVALLAARKASPNGAEYGGAEVAAQQQKGYPDIRPKVLALPPAQAFDRALEAARGMGWEIAEANAAAGRIEATATTPFFGFKDDVVVRIAPEGASSRVDVRSVSRVGTSDIGANARRVQEYLSKLT